MASTSQTCCLMWVALLSCITLCPISLGEECTFGEKIVNNLRYSTAGCKYVNVSRDITPETIEMDLNETEGTLTVFFPLSWPDTYTVELFSNKQANTSGECMKFQGDMVTEGRKYLIRKFSASSCKDATRESVSQVRGSVVFQFVYSSCYVVRMRDVHVDSKPRLLATKYISAEKETAVGSVDASSELYNGTRNVTIHFRKFDLLVRDKIPVHMTLVQNKTCKDKYTNDNIIARYSVQKMDDGTLKCTNQNNLPFLKSCKVDGSASSCTFINLIPGNYCLKVDPDEPDICPPGASPYVGYISCPFHHTFDVHGETKVEKPPKITANTTSNLLLYLAVFLSIFSFIVIGGIIRTLHQNLPTLEPPQLKIIHSKPEVLLLYAQDCEIFMELMAVFREVLSAIGQCKVLDCFDYNCDSMTLNPAEWIQQLTTCEDIKIILVSSPCAEIHQRALKEKKTVQYYDPKPYNNLYTLALCNVKHNIQRTYTNTFVVRFDHTDLESIMPYTRYNLPGNLLDLLTDMHLFSSTDKRRLQESEIVKELDILHIKLNEYFKENPYYVKQLMYSLQS